MVQHRSPARWFRPAVTVAIVLAMAWPMVRNVDGLPLSTYPMYAGARADTLMLITAQGTDSTGEPVSLSMPEIADTRDPLIAQAFLNDAAAAGRTAEVCNDIATRVGGEVTRIELARERHDVVAYAAGESSLVERDVLAECEVGQ